MTTLQAINLELFTVTELREVKEGEVLGSVTANITSFPSSDDNLSKIPTEIIAGCNKVRILDE